MRHFIYSRSNSYYYQLVLVVNLLWVYEWTTSSPPCLGCPGPFSKFYHLSCKIKGTYAVFFLFYFCVNIIEVFLGTFSLIELLLFVVYAYLGKWGSPRGHGFSIYC